MDGLKIMPVQMVGAVSKCMASPQSYASYMPGREYRAPTKQRIAEYALQQLEAARKLDVDTHEANLPALSANAAVREKIAAFMTEIGMPKTRKERAGTRYGLPKYKTVDAGWLCDIRENVLVDDGFTSATHTYGRLKAAYDEYLRDGVREAEAAATEAARADERKKAERRENLELAEIILRYDLDRDAEWDDVLTALRKRDQRLDLAVAMKQTRGDWSDGYWRVSDALSRFVVTTPEDAEIQTDILACFNDDIDGRVFRDTAWNYGRLFETAADQQLAKDVALAASKVRDF